MGSSLSDESSSSSSSSSSSLEEDGGGGGRFFFGGAAFFCGWSLDRGTSSSLESLSESPAVGGGGFGGASAIFVSPSPSRASLEELCACICASGTSSSLSELDIFCCLRGGGGARCGVWSGLGPGWGRMSASPVGALIAVVEEELVLR